MVQFALVAQLLFNGVSEQSCHQHKCRSKHVSPTSSHTWVFKLFILIDIRDLSMAWTFTLNFENGLATLKLTQNEWFTGLYDETLFYIFTSCRFFFKILLRHFSTIWCQKWKMSMSDWDRLFTVLYEHDFVVIWVLPIITRVNSIQSIFPGKPVTS